MPQLYNKAVITNAGLALLNKAQAGAAAIQFTRMAVGNGIYSAEEKTPSALRERDGLKSEKNSYALSSIDAASADGVKLTALLTNQDPVTGEALVTEGYYMNEIGLYAQEKDADGDTEVLYSVAVAMVENGDYMPPFASGSVPAQTVQEYHAAVGNASDITIKYTGAAMLAEDAEERLQEILEAIPPVDPELDSDSENPVQNKAVAGRMAELALQISQISTAWDAQKLYIDGKIADLINGAPETLDTLKEVADAIQENETIVDALNAAIGNKVDKVAGKGLSTNDFSTDLMNKLNGAASVGELIGGWKSAPFSATGWHRIAKIQGSACDSCVVSIKRGFSNNNNECHKVEFISTYQSVIFKSVYDKTNENNLLFSKIRFVKGGALSFIDVYYKGNKINYAVITIGDGRNVSGGLWELLVNEVVPETATDETVLAELEFEANSWVGDSNSHVENLTLSTNWSGASAPFTQTIAVEGVTTDSVVHIDVQSNISAEQLDAFINAKIVDGGQSTNSITLKAFGEKPEAAIPIKVVVG